MVLSLTLYRDITGFLRQRVSVLSNPEYGPWLCYECSCHLKIHMLKSKVMALGGGALGRRLGREGRAGIRVLKEEGAQSSQPLAASEDRVRTRPSEPGGGSSPEPEPGGVMISDFPPPEMRNECSLSTSHPLRAALLQRRRQPPSSRPPPLSDITGRTPATHLLRRRGRARLRLRPCASRGVRGYVQRVGHGGHDRDLLGLEMIVGRLATD